MTRMYQPVGLGAAGIPGAVSDINLVDDYHHHQHHHAPVSTDTQSPPVISKFLQPVLNSAAAGQATDSSTAAVLAHYDTAGSTQLFSSLTALAHAR